MADESHRISLEEAVQMVARARQDATREIKAWRFASPIVRSILDQPGVTSIRAYMARNAEGRQTLVLVGTDSDGNDLSAGTIAEFALPCPPWCDEGSPFFAP